MLFLSPLLFAANHMANSSFFTTALLNWYQPDQRPLPWKHIKDPYLIWLSEIILQQTRAEQGRPYFEKFKTAYPTIIDLAQASEDEIFKHWEGLGYYSRARNLHATAKLIAAQYNGRFPSTYPEILALKGVGPYTAAAIASFAFNLPHAVVDGNVYRILARYANDATPIDTTQGKRLFSELAQGFLPTDNPAIFNQAIMDLGATVCTPKRPQCPNCPLQPGCQAFEHNTQLQRPIKSKKLQRKTRFFNYLIVQSELGSIIHQRRDKDIWRQLYQFPLIESAIAVDKWDKLTQHTHWPAWLPAAGLVPQRKSGPWRQDLTHQRIVATFWEAKWTHTQSWQLPEDYLIVKRKNWATFAFPKIINLYFDDNSLTLF